MDETKIMKKQIDNLTIKSEGIRLEYEYVNNLKDRRIEELTKSIQKHCEEEKYYKEEFQEVVRKMEQYQQELEQIKNSRWWKLRGK